MRRIFLCLACWGTLVITAQTPGPEPLATPTPPPSHNLSLRFYTWPIKGILHDGMDIPALPMVYMRQGQGWERIPLQRGAQTPPIRYAQYEPPLLVAAPAVNTGSPGSLPAAPVPIARVDIPSAWNQAVVILFPEDLNPDGTWTSLPIRSSSLEIPSGKTYFYNSTLRQVVAEADGQMQAVPPGQGVMMDLQRTSDRERIRIRLHGRDARGKVRMLYTGSNWNSGTRGNLYLIYEQSGEQLRVLRLSETEPAPEPTPLSPPPSSPASR